MEADLCVYVCWQGDKPAIIMLYVNDLVILMHLDLLVETKKVLTKHFPVKDLEEPASILSIEVIHNHQCGQLKLRQSGHITSILSKASMVNCKPITTPMELGLHLKKIMAKVLNTAIPSNHQHAALCSVCYEVGHLLKCSVPVPVCQSS